MPARGTAITATIPVDVMLDLTRDPDKFDARLEEFVAREKAAQDAERKNAVRLQAAEKLERETEEKTLALEKANADYDAKVVRTDQRLEAANETLRLGKRDQEIERQRLDERDRKIDARTDELTERDREQDARETKQDERDKALDKLDEDLIRDRAEFSARQTKLDADLADLRKRLNGFSL